MNNYKTNFLGLHHYPIHKLNDEEINDPYLVIRELFQFAHLPDLRDMLWTSLKTNITGGYHKGLTHREKNEIVCLYELINKLVEAAHLINEKRKMEADAGH